MGLSDLVKNYMPLSSGPFGFHAIPFYLQVASEFCEAYASECSWFWFGFSEFEANNDLRESVVLQCPLNKAKDWTDPVWISILGRSPSRWNIYLFFHGHPLMASAFRYPGVTMQVIRNQFRWWLSEWLDVVIDWLEDRIVAKSPTH